MKKIRRSITLIALLTVPFLVFMQLRETGIEFSGIQMLGLYFACLFLFFASGIVGFRFSQTISNIQKILSLPPNDRAIALAVFLGTILLGALSLGYIIHILLQQ